jgi:hypothetical protein
LRGSHSAEYFVGLDLGQSRDHTAIAVLERAELGGDWDPVMFAHLKVVELRLRYLERVALGTPYPEVVARVRQVTRSEKLAGRCRLIADATGVGRPVIDLLRIADLGCSLWPATITSGEMETQQDGNYRVPKRDLIVGLQVLFQQEALQIAGGLEYGPALMAEMAAMQVKITPAGNEQYGAWREGDHDDLVLAVALACWGVRKAYPRALAGDDRWCRWQGDL